VITLSWNTFRSRWQLFLGAIVCVAVGVALVQSSLRVLAATASPRVPPGLTPWQEADLRDTYDGATTLMGMTTFLAAFLAVFVVSSTFAFTVAQRRRELALLRLVGGSTGQLRALLLAEALLLGVCGTALGIPLGEPLVGVQVWLLSELGFVPGGLTTEHASWVVLAAGGTGIGVALLGVLTASRRAAKVRPLEALRSEDGIRQVMTPARWFFGLGFLACSALLVVLSAGVSLLFAVALSMMLTITGAIALSLLSPLAVPLVGRLFGLVLRANTLGGLAEANLRDGVRRSAATAAPLIVLVSLLLGLFGALSSLARASGEEQKQIVDADLVVASTGAEADRIAAVPGVALASPEIAVPMILTKNVIDVDSGDPEQEEQHTGIVAVDPDAYQRTHRTEVSAGGLADLHGPAIVLTGLSEQRIDLGAPVEANLNGRVSTLHVVAVLPERLSAAETALVPRDQVPRDVLASAQAQTAVKVAPDTDPATVADAIRAAGIGTVSTLADWAASSSTQQQDFNVRTMVVLMGLSGLYALIAVVNAVVMAGADRKREFAVVRVAGLDRGQVVRMALVESWAVAAIGLFLGALVVAGTMLGVAAGIYHAVGSFVVVVPWQLTTVVTLGAFVVVGVTSALTTWSATRVEPVRLVVARE